MDNIEKYNCINCPNYVAFGECKLTEYSINETICPLVLAKRDKVTIGYAIDTYDGQIIEVKEGEEDEYNTSIYKTTDSLIEAINLAIEYKAKELLSDSQSQIDDLQEEIY